MDKSQLEQLVFYRLPFRSGTRILDLDTLNRHSDIRRPARPYLRISTKKLCFINEVLIASVTLGEEQPERVYLKVTENELLVSCSVDTDESYLSRYAYFMLLDNISIYNKAYFEDYYWPGTFGQQGNKFLIIKRKYGQLQVSLKQTYIGFYKPGQTLPDLSDTEVQGRGCQEFEPHWEPLLHSGNSRVIGYCLAAMVPKSWLVSHYPFLIPYIAKTTKDGNGILTFEKFVSDAIELEDLDYSSNDQQLINLCYEMKEYAVICEDGGSQEAGQHKSRRVFELWHKAASLFATAKYKHYHYSFGMRQLKGKPKKHDMFPCTFINAKPLLVFLWKDKGNHYLLELRVKIFNKIHRLPERFFTDYFIATKQSPYQFLLLGSLADCKVVSFFCKSNYQMVILKRHYTGAIHAFIGRLDELYQIIKG
jgi:hypothetical protein